MRRTVDRFYSSPSTVWTLFKPSSFVVCESGTDKPASAPTCGSRLNGLYYHFSFLWRRASSQNSYLELDVKFRAHGISGFEFVFVHTDHVVVNLQRDAEPEFVIDSSGTRILDSVDDFGFGENRRCCS